MTAVAAALFTRLIYRAQSVTLRVSGAVVVVKGLINESGLTDERWKQTAGSFARDSDITRQMTTHRTVTNQSTVITDTTTYLLGFINYVSSTYDSILNIII